MLLNGRQVNSVVVEPIVEKDEPRCKAIIVEIIIESNVLIDLRPVSGD